MLSLLFTNPLAFFILITLLITAISVHEFFHAWMADRLGDPTARISGRLTLDPRAHLDPVGTFLLLFVGFGWGRPVPFDPFNLKDPKRDSALISFAGPLSNFSMAILSSIMLRILFLIPFSPVTALLTTVFSTFLYFNILLALFNLIPIYPLDGFTVVAGLLPRRYYDEWMDLARYGMIFLFFLIFPFFGSSPVSTILSPIIQLLVSFLTPGSGTAGII